MEEYLLGESFDNSGNALFINIPIFAKIKNHHFNFMDGYGVGFHYMIDGEKYKKIYNIWIRYIYVRQD